MKAAIYLWFVPGLENEARAETHVPHGTSDHLISVPQHITRPNKHSGEYSM